MKSYRPIKSNWCTQAFGENRACSKKRSDGTYELQAKIGLTCTVGYEDFYKSMGMNGHNGIDWMTWHGEPVYHCDEFDGWTRYENDDAGGLGVDVVSNEPILFCPLCNEKHFIKRRFWHGMDRGGKSALVGIPGRQVKLGDLVMYADNTGASSGDHLHTSLKWCDREGVGIHSNNGYYGAFPDTEFQNNFVGDVAKINDLQVSLIGLLRSYIITLTAQLYATKNH
jgi:hypothetical protein